MALDASSVTLVVHVAIREQKKMAMNLAKKSYVEVQIRALIFNEVLTIILAEYSDYSNVFSMENISKLSENSERNNNFIKLKINKQQSF